MWMTRPSRNLTPVLLGLSLSLLPGWGMAQSKARQNAQTSQSAAQPAPAAAPAPSGPAAFRVNGEAQPQARFDLLLREQLERGATDTPELRARIREVMLTQSVMAQEAVRMGIDRQSDTRALLELNRQNTLAQLWQQQQMRDAQVSDADIAAEYQRQVQAMGKEEFRIRHVLLADENTARQTIDRFQKGTSIATLAAELSRDPVSRERGGLSDWLPEGRLTPEVLKVVQSLNKGQLHSTPVQTPTGWQVLMLEDKRPFAAVPLDNVKAQIRNALALQMVQAKLKTLRDAAKVE